MTDRPLFTINLAGQLISMTEREGREYDVLRPKIERAVAARVAELEAKLDDAVKLAESNGRIAQIHKAANVEIEAKVAGLRLSDARPVIDRAMEIAREKVGDPIALDINGWPRWLWYISDAHAQLRALTPQARKEGA